MTATIPEPVGDFGLHQSPSPGAPRRKGSPTAQISLGTSMDKIKLVKSTQVGKGIVEATLSPLLSASWCQAAGQPRR